MVYVIDWYSRAGDLVVRNGEILVRKWALGQVQLRPSDVNGWCRDVYYCDTRHGLIFF